MDALEAIRTRVSRPRVGAEPPSREEIEELLDLAVRAPTHGMTEPWRFYVLSGAARDRLANAIAAANVDAGMDEAAALEDGRKKVGRAPVIVVFTCVPGDGPKVVEQEEIASVAMAMQNFLIGAHAKGIGAMPRTGPAAYHPAICSELGLAENESVLGFVYVGYPDAERPLTPRAQAAEKTRWLDA
jgi:nitroreductase